MTEKNLLLPPISGENGNDARYRVTMMVPKRQYFSYLRERWWVVLIGVVLAVSAAVVLETFLRQSYTSYTELYTSGEVQLGMTSLFNEESQTYYGTQIELLKSSRLKQDAIERMGYTPRPGEKLPTLEVVRPQGTALLEVRAKGSDPVLTQRFLQALIDTYLAYKKETRRTTSEDIVASLTDQVAAKEKDLKTAQEKWTDFQRSNNVAVLAEDSRSAGAYLSDLNLQLARLKLDCGLLKAGLNPLPDGRPAGAGTATNGTSAVDVAAVPGGSYPSTGQATSSENALQSVRLELGLLRIQRDQALAAHGPAAARGMSDEVTNLEERVSLLTQQALDEKKTTLDQLQKRLLAIETSIPTWEQKMSDLNERLAEGEQLKNNIAREQAYYDHLLSTLLNVDLSRNVQPERIQVLQAPTAAAPAADFLAVRIAVALALGLAAGLGLVFCWYLLDDRLVSVQDVKDQFGEAVWGLVPQIKVSRTKPEQAFLQPNDTRVVYAESFRHLRSALMLSSAGEQRPRTLLITGAAAGEGKTTIAVNLARALAAGGLRVTLVDADLRNGQMHHLFGLQNNFGLLDVLRGAAELPAVVQPTGLAGLDFVPAGDHPEEADGIFLRSGLENLLAELKAGCDFVILDGPPMLAADDAALLVPQVDAVVVVVRPFFSSSRLIRQTLDMLYQRQAKQVAIIFNQARKDDVAGHYAKSRQKQPGKNGTLAKA
jgi:capsular exopolysaccharide synthesis family protein